MAVSERIFISVRNGRAYVSRSLTESDGSFTWENATNTHALEADAAAAVTAQGGTLTQHGEYECPPDLAARAHWHVPHHS